MKIEFVDIKKVKENPDNPRVIKDKEFNLLVKSITEFPQMLEIRPTVVNDKWMVLGGNRRLAACKAAKMKKIPIIHAKDLTEEQQRRFIIADNKSSGEWDYDLLRQWDKGELTEWGLDIPDLVQEVDMDNFFEEQNSAQKEQGVKITLEFSEDDGAKVMEAFKKHSGSKEAIVFKLLGL